MHAMHDGAVLRASIITGIAYALPILALGFVLGVVRTLVLRAQPGWPAWAAVSMELPAMLFAAWWWLGRLAHGRHDPDYRSSALLVGLSAFFVLMTTETLLGLLVGRTLADEGRALMTLPGALGLLGQVAFAALPLLRAGSRP